MGIRIVVGVVGLLLVLPIAVPAQPTGEQRIRVFVASGRLADGTYEWVTHTQGVAEFHKRKECTGLRVTNRIQRAHYLLTFERIASNAENFGRNDVSVYDGWGDLIYAGSTLRFGNAVKDACIAIRRELLSGEEPVTMQDSAFQ